MTDLSSVLERLGLHQYLDNFIEEGFETWEIVLYATELDLETVGLKIGHRRKLQKEIAEARGVSIEQIINSATRTHSTDDSPHADPDNRSTTSHGDHKSANPGPSKRKYRRHPKPDEHAPERAPSAYVIFSNKIREELKPQKLSFTDIAKTVGERWQVLDPEEKEQYETQAATAKEQYINALTKYKRTSQYRDYQKYLANFKARNTPPSTAGTKRPKLETEISGASSSGGSISHSEREARRRDSQASQQPVYSPPISSAASPTALAYTHPGSRDSSSTPSTPVVAVPSIGGGNLQLLANQRGGVIQSQQQLPRILPLDSRDTRQQIPNLLTAPTNLVNPRRSGASASPANFLREETSKSSVGSTYSGNSTGSSVYTPITPIDETRSSRSLPPLPVLSQHNSADSAPSVDLDRYSAPGLPARFGGGEVGEHTTNRGPGYHQSFHQLSLNPEQIRSQSLSKDNQQMHNTGGPSTQSLPSRSVTDPSGSANTERLDSLSVLALAGRIVDRDETEPSDLIKRNQ